MTSDGILLHDHQSRVATPFGFCVIFDDSVPGFGIVQFVVLTIPYQILVASSRAHYT